MSSGALPIQGCGAKIEDRMLLNLVEFIYVSQASQQVNEIKITSEVKVK